MRQSRVGDTVTSLHGVQPNRCCVTKTPNGLPACTPSTADYPVLRDALDRLKLNDAAFAFEPETSAALGFGFRCGFLGLLHLEIVRNAWSGVRPRPDLHCPQRGVPGRHGRRHRDHRHQPQRIPGGKVAEVYEPSYVPPFSRPANSWARSWNCARSARHLLGMDYLSEERVEMRYVAARGNRVRLLRPAQVPHPRLRILTTSPMANRAQILSRSTSSFRARQVDAFSAIVHRDKAYAYGVMMTAKLRSLIPRQQFEVPIQAAIGSRVIAARRSARSAKTCWPKRYGGDISRKRKLLEKQKGQEAYEDGGTGGGSARGLHRRTVDIRGAAVSLVLLTGSDPFPVRAAITDTVRDWRLADPELGVEQISGSSSDVRMRIAEAGGEDLFGTRSILVISEADAIGDAVDALLDAATQSR